MKKDIYTISATNIATDEDVTPMRYCINYESEDTAINAARELAQEFADDEDVINVSVYGGEYETEQGVFGEPFDFYTISNKEEFLTWQARYVSGYVSMSVDEYI